MSSLFRILILALLGLTLTACGKGNVREPPPPIEINVVPPLVCDQAPQIDKIEIKDIEFRPVWGIDAAPLRDVRETEDSEPVAGSTAPRIQTVAPNTYRVPDGSQPAMWVGLSADMYSALAVNTAETLKQTRQLKAVVDYLRNCISRYSVEQQKAQSNEASAQSGDSGTDTKPAQSSATGQSQSSPDSKGSGSCKKYFFQFWRKKCEPSG